MLGIRTAEDKQCINSILQSKIESPTENNTVMKKQLVLGSKKIENKQYVNSILQSKIESPTENNTGMKKQLVLGIDIANE